MNTSSKFAAAAIRFVVLKTLKASCLSALFAVALFAAPSAFAASPSIWNGGGADDLWNNAANWNANVPVPGAAYDLQFAGTTRLNNTNDFTAASNFRHLVFNSGAGAFTNWGNSITLNGNVTNGSTSLQTINLPIVLAASTVFNTTNGSLAVGGAISGSGFGLTKFGTNTLTLSGTNTYTGPTVVSLGTLTRSDIGGSSASAATMVVGNTANVNTMMKILPGANVTNFNLAIGGVANARGAVYQSGGTFTLGAVATANTAEAFVIGGPVTAATAGGAYGYYNLSGGSMSADALAMHQANNGGTRAHSVVDITGGTLAIANYIRITRSGNGGWNDRSSFNVLGGAVTAAQIIQGNCFEPTLFTVGGGAGAASVTTVGSATLGYEMIESSGNSGNNAPPNVGSLLANGTLTVGKVNATSTSRNTSTFFNFNGGTLKATTVNAGATFLTAANLTLVSVYSGGGTIDNNGTAITIGKVLAAPAGVGLTGGTLTKGSGYIGAPFVEITGGTANNGNNNRATAIAIMEDDTTGNGTYRVASILITSPGSYSAAPTGANFNGGGPTTAATFTSLTSAANTSGGMTFQGAGGTTTLTAANTYTGNTTVSSGTLALTGSGSLASANINVGSGAIFDVSAISYTLAASKTLLGSGSVNGSVATAAASSSIIPATQGTVGTLTFNNNLNMGSGGSARFDLSPTGGGSNDKIVVTGNLTLSSSDTITIDPVTANTLDQAADYVLFQVSGTTTMTTTPALVWGTSTPANSANYVITTSGNNVVLHYSTIPVVGTTAYSPASPVYAGTPVTLSASVAGGIGALTYQWQGSGDNTTWTNIPSATSSTYALNTTGQGGTTTYYRLVVTDSISQVGTGTGAALVVNAASAPIITGLTITPSTVNSGGAVSMTASYNGTLPMTSFQWQFSLDNTTWLNISGATSSSNNIASAVFTQAGYYRVIAGNSVGSTTSSSAQLIVQTVLIDPTTRNGSFELVSGASGSTAKVNFSTATVDNWAVWTGVSTASSDSGTDDAVVAGINGLRLAFLQPGNADYNLTTYSNRAGDVFTYTFNMTPGQAGTFNVQLGYWNGSAVVTNANTASLTTVTAGGTQIGLGTNWTVPNGDPSIGKPVALTMRNVAGNYPQVDNFVLTVKPAINGLTITTNPASATVSVNDSTNFTVAATTDGTVTGYQWYVVTAGPVTNAVTNGVDGAGTTLSGTTTATLSLSNIQVGDNGNTYYCAVSSSFGMTSNSTAATLTVLALPVVGTTVFSPVSPVYAGTAVTLSASVAGGTPAYNYQWQAGPDNSTWTNIPSATSATYPLNTTGQDGTTNYYRLVVTDSASQVGNGTGAALVVNTASAPIITGVTITPSPVTQGGNVSMTATYDGTFPITSYQWQVSRDGGSTWTNISGATSSSNVISGVQLTDAGQYRVIAANSVGSTTSSSATLTAQKILINPTTRNGSFELVSGVPGGAAKVNFSTGTVDSWTNWPAYPNTGDTGADDSAGASDGTRDAFLQGNSGIYNLTTHTIRAGDVFTYTWDWALAARGPATAQLGYWDAGAVVLITGTDTSNPGGGAQQLGIGTTWTVLGGDPAIGKPMVMTVYAPNLSNYPEVDNFVLTVIPSPTTAPTAANFSLGVAVGGSATAHVIGKYAAATDADGDPVTISAVSTPANGTASIVGGTNITYTSTNSAASDSFTYTVSDGLGGTDTKTVTVSTYSPEGFNRLSPPSVIGPGTVTLSYLGIPGYNYALDWATNLTPPINWMAVITNTAAGDGSLSYTNSSSEPVNFFRTRYAP